MGWEEAQIKCQKAIQEALNERNKAMVAAPPRPQPVLQPIKPPSTPRGHILEHARKLTEGDRNQEYGRPIESIQAFIDLVNAYLKNRPEGYGPLDLVDGAIIYEMTKISRIAKNKQHSDNYPDGSAYMAIAGECAQHQQKRKKEKEDDLKRFYKSSSEIENELLEMKANG